MKKIIYLDNAATTRVDDEVLKEMLPYFKETYGNSASLHASGALADEAMKKARNIIAKSLNARDEEIIFTSGGTESNNFAIKGIALLKKNKGKHLITTKVEHDSVINIFKWLESEGYHTTYLNVDKSGVIDIEELKKSIRKDTILVSIIHGNNEVGTIQDIALIGKICKEKNVIFHTDACQSYTKVGIDVKKINADLVTINAHKIHGPKGVGALYIKKGIKIIPLLHGGGQEFRLRSGTSNISGIVGFGKSAEVAFKHMKKKAGKMSNLRDKMIDELLKIPNAELNGPVGNKRLCNNINITFDFVEGEAILKHLDMMGIEVSTGSACSSKSLKPSHVLVAIGKNPDNNHGAIRITLSKYTTSKEIDIASKKIKEVVLLLRKLSPLRQKT